MVEWHIVHAIRLTVRFRFVASQCISQMVSTAIRDAMRAMHKSSLTDKTIRFIQILYAVDYCQLPKHERPTTKKAKWKTQRKWQRDNSSGSSSRYGCDRKQNRWCDNCLNVHMRWTPWRVVDASTSARVQRQPMLTWKLKLIYEWICVFGAARECLAQLHGNFGSADTLNVNAYIIIYERVTWLCAVFAKMALINSRATMAHRQARPMPCACECECVRGKERALASHNLKCWPCIGMPMHISP